MEEKYSQIINDVAVDEINGVKYIVKENGFIIGYCNNFDFAKTIVESLSVSREDELRNDSSKILRENVSEKNVQIYVQSLGMLFDGAPTLKYDFVIESIKCLVYHTFDTSEKTEEKSEEE